MRTYCETWIAPLVFEYFLAFFAAFLASVLADVVVLAHYNFPEDVSDVLKCIRIVSFVAITVGGFCFSPRSRWVHSAVLLGFGLVFYCAMDQVRTVGNGFLRMHPFPLLGSLAVGGSVAIVLHCLIDLVWFVKGGIAGASCRN
jgi:hypothetical protein